jgi:riboflavin transporter FmnP
MLLKNIIIGIKKGYNIQILSDKVLFIMNHPISRILRVIGGISFLLTISKSIKLLTTSKIIIIIIQILGMIFMVYCLILNIYRIKRVIEIIKNKEYEVKDSTKIK